MRGLVPAPGTLVWIRQQPWRVERARLDRGVVRLDVAQGERTLAFLTPFDRPVIVVPRSAPMRARRRQIRARVARALAGTCSFDTPAVARDAQVNVLPHQLEPVLAVLSGRRRLLIADAVGLGKTIQAGLALAELQRRHANFRALVIAPAALIDQWVDELQRRFNLRSETADREGLDACVIGLSFGTNPWTRPGVWVATADFLKQPHIFDALPATPWDALVIDEAHGVVGPSERYATCHELGRRARHVLMLTATPHSGDDSRFDRLLRLGALPDCQDDLVVFQRSRVAAGVDIKRAVRWHRITLSADALLVHDGLARFERVVLDGSRPGRRDQILLLLSIFRKRAVSTLHALDRTLERRLEWLDAPERAHQPDWLQPRLHFEGDDNLSSEEREALIIDTGLTPLRERAWLRRLRALVRAAAQHDDKVVRLTGLVARAREPVVIFTEYRDSLKHLDQHLGRWHTVAVLHGGQDRQQQRQALQHFLDGHATVLISTDVGGQGLNLQTRTRWVINLELPWNPIRLEQRIGRVDRIGQQRAVHVTLLVARHRAEETVLTRLARRVLAAARAVGPYALADIAPPTERAVAEALMTDAQMAVTEVPARTTLVGCERWKRRARALARITIHQRSLRRRWQGPIDTVARPRWMRSSREVSVAHPPRSLVLLATVPIIDGTGAVVERHAIAIRVATPVDERGVTWATVAAQQAAARRLASRIVRVGRALAVAGLGRIEVERAIGRHLDERSSRQAGQPRLFGPRSAHPVDEDHGRTRAQSQESADAIRAVRDRGRLEIGRVSIEAVWPSRS